ncbi:hypothetical protein A3Q56_03457 [Intoshia linei]|uniref:NADH dehydrogenase [ubiquinone] 1 alpha subcomplex assembly factor 4 n=1 Tax=Intoshia linei TaxID=1819745 RepID=A0A177B3D3_9BILA|nr:hypothetical protein A3Q56_03457 [Intoshia linei]
MGKIFSSLIVRPVTKINADNRAFNFIENLEKHRISQYRKKTPNKTLNTSNKSHDKEVEFDKEHLNLISNMINVESTQSTQNKESNIDNVDISSYGLRIDDLYSILNTINVDKKSIDSVTKKYNINLKDVENISSYLGVFNALCPKNKTINAELAKDVHLKN